MRNNGLPLEEEAHEDQNEEESWKEDDEDPHTEILHRSPCYFKGFVGVGVSSVDTEPTKIERTRCTMLPICCVACSMTESRDPWLLSNKMISPAWTIQIHWSSSGTPWNLTST